MIGFRPTAFDLGLATVDIPREQIDCPSAAVAVKSSLRGFETEYAAADAQKLLCLIYALIRFICSCRLLDIVVGINTFLVNKIYVASELHEFSAVCRMISRNLAKSSNYGTVFRSRTLAIMLKKHGTRSVVHRIIGRMNSSTWSPRAIHCSRFSEMDAALVPSLLIFRSRLGLLIDHRTTVPSRAIRRANSVRKWPWTGSK